MGELAPLSLRPWTVKNEAVRFVVPPMLVAVAAVFVSFVVIALVVGTLVARAEQARRRSARGEREARLRLELTNRLLQGEEIDTVVAAAARSIVSLFDLASCTLRTVGTSATSTSSLAPGRAVEVRTDEAALEAMASAKRPLTAPDRDVLEALVASLGIVFVRTDLERAASDARVESEVNRARAAFFAAAGHNLRTPLASVGAAVSALLDTGDVLDDAERRELLVTIRQETDRLARMVTKVLSQSRIRAGSLVPAPEPVDLGGMVQVSVRRLGPLGADHPMHLDVSTDVGPLWLDVTMLEQILLNLLENAVRFAPRGTEIGVVARLVAGEVELRVIDHGPGVPEAEREAIFEEFHRADPRTDVEGTGLGLAIVRALVSVQGGTVRCEETPGGGATFVVRFPARRDADDDDVVVPSPASGGQP